MTAKYVLGDGHALRVLVLCSSFIPGFRAGGPVRSVEHILNTAPGAGGISLITRDRDVGDDKPYDGLSGRWNAHGASRVYYLNLHSLKQWIRLIRDLRRQPRDLMYLNSLWSPTFTIVPLLGMRLRIIPASHILLAPRGELSPGALSLKASKKRVFFKFWRPFLNSLPLTWHASTNLEREHILKSFPGATVIVNSDQSTLLPDLPLSPGRASGDIARLVFISRISPKKNLLSVIQAMQLNRSDVEFDIYGPVEDKAYWRVCQRAMNTLPDNVRVRFRGEVRPEDVHSIFRMYDAFVFPTLGENFGHVIAESLSSSCPVICSEHTPWTEVLRAGGGSIFDDLSARGVALAIQEVVSRSPERRAADRVRAGEAYRRWQSERVVTTHIFDEVRGSASAGRVSTCLNEV